MTNGAGADEPVEQSSPACSMHEASDAYMGYAGREELVAALNELLEAERAGARVASETARDAGEGTLAALMRALRKDESRWCAMLSGHIKARGGVPSDRVGAFHAKAMAIADLGARVDVLSRGQEWMVRRLQQLLPRVRDDRLHADLNEMLRAHEANIALAGEAKRGGSREA